VFKDLVPEPDLDLVTGEPEPATVPS
jgi:hypothetical protein